MKVLGIAASPRRNANTEILLDCALRGARDKGAGTEKVVLNLLKIKPCQACARCSETAVCYIKDDMRALLKKLKTCNALIIASPVYFGTVTAQLKIMIDRCQPVWIEKHILGKRFPKKRMGMFISVSNYNNKNFFRNSKEIISILFAVLGIRLSSELYIPCLENRDDARNNLLLSKKAFQRGQSLAKSILPGTSAKG
jgi:multimeric flavodoxin WrbA